MCCPNGTRVRDNPVNSIVQISTGDIFRPTLEAVQAEPGGSPRLGTPELTDDLKKVTGQNYKGFPLNVWPVADFCAQCAGHWRGGNPYRSFEGNLFFAAKYDDLIDTFWRQNCQCSPPPPPPGANQFPPIKGGQCVCVTYIVDWDYTVDGDPTPRTASFRPAYGPLLFSVVPNTVGPGKDWIVAFGSPPQCPSASYPLLSNSSGSGKIDAVRIRRADGLPDECGDPPSDDGPYPQPTDLFGRPLLPPPPNWIDQYPPDIVPPPPVAPPDPGSYGYPASPVNLPDLNPMPSFPPGEASPPGCFCPAPSAPLPPPVVVVPPPPIPVECEDMLIVERPFDFPTCAPGGGTVSRELSLPVVIDKNGNTNAAMYQALIVTLTEMYKGNELRCFKSESLIHSSDVTPGDGVRITGTIPSRAALIRVECIVSPNYKNLRQFVVNPDPLIGEANLGHIAFIRGDATLIPRTELVTRSSVIEVPRNVGSLKVRLSMRFAGQIRVFSVES